MKKKFAVFDIDGTIFQWQFFHELFDELVEEKIADKDTSEQVFEARKKWRAGNMTWDEYEAKLLVALNNAILGINKVLLEKLSDRIISKKGSVLYRYTLNLLKTLQAKDYVTIVISGSQQPIVEKFSKMYDIDIAIGVDYEYIEGKMVGIKRPTYGRKAELLNQVVAENNLTWKDSYAIGDSSGDAPMLELVENPIAFNPDEKLLEIAKEKGWKIVIERKSIAYSLEKGSNGSYILA